jgi:DNA-binding NtrC family response regulator
MAEVIAFPERRKDRHTVLVVDDEFLMRGVLVEILQDSGFDTIAAASAEEAMTCLTGPAHVDLVFSDIKMPGIDGFTLARWIHLNHPDMPVILVSGYPGKANMAAELCQAEFLRKPCDFELIVTKIRETIARRAQRTA